MRARPAKTSKIAAKAWQGRRTVKLRHGRTTQQLSSKHTGLYKDNDNSASICYARSALLVYPLAGQLCESLVRPSFRSASVFGSSSPNPVWNDIILDTDDRTPEKLQWMSF